MKPTRRTSVVCGTIAVAAMFIGAIVVIAERDRVERVVAASEPAATTSTSSPMPTSTVTSSTTTEPPTTTTSPPPVTTTAPPMPQTATFHAEDGTITIDVTVEPAYPRAGELVHFRVSATDSEGGTMSSGFVPGDRRLGGGAGRTIVECFERESNASTRRRAPVHETFEVTHTYRVAAERRFEVSIATSACSRQSHYAELSATITVLPGAVTSNGPRAPEGFVLQNDEGAPSGGVLMSIGASDADGVAQHVEVDWGDGSAPSAFDVERGEHDCIDEPTAYPSSHELRGLEHVYPGPGTYTITARIVSTGCDGKDEQFATATRAVTIETASGG